MTNDEASELLAACKRQRDVWRIGGMPPSPEAVARVERDEAVALAAIVEDYDREHAARVAAEAEADRLRSLCHEWEAAADAVTPSDHTPDALRRRGETLVTQANTQARTLSEVVALRSLLAAVARGELGSCFECWRFAMRAHANGDQCCDKHSDDNDPEAWSDLPHAAAIRGALKATKGER